MKGLVAVFITLWQLVFASDVSISATGDVVAGRPYTLKCEITRPTGDRSYLIWYRDVDQKMSCIYASRECTTSIPVSALSPAGISGGCQLLNGEEVYTLTIQTVTEDVGRGEWLCQFRRQTASVTVDVPVGSVSGASISATGDVVVGRPYTLKCEVTRPTGDISYLIWYRDVDETMSRIYASIGCASSIPVSQFSPIGLSGGCYHVNGEEVYTVTIKGVTEDKVRGRWLCQFRNQTASVVVDVKVGSVSALSISGTGDVVVGRTFTLKCEVTRPTGDRSYLLWSRDVYHTISRIYASHECTSSMSVSPSSPAGLSGGCHHVNGEEVYTVTIKNVTEDVGRGRWLCQFRNQTASVTVDVPVGSASALSISATGDVVVGRPYTLKCEVSRPIRYGGCLVWSRDVDQTTFHIYDAPLCTRSIPTPAGFSGRCQRVNGEEVYSLTIKKVTEDTGRGRWLCQYREQTASVTLDVPDLAQGDVVVGRPFTLECKITRQTSDTSVLFWYRDDDQNSSRIYASSVCTSSIPVSPSSPTGLSGGCHHVNGEEVYTVTIQNVTEDTGRGRWRCQYAENVVDTKLNIKVRSVKGLSISAPRNIVAGCPFTLECKITRLPGDRSVLIWTRDVGQNSSRIYGSSVCTSSIPVLPSSPAGISGGCQHVSGEEVYTVTIEKITEDAGLGKWSCQCGRGTDQVTLDVQVNCIT